MIEKKLIQVNGGKTINVDVSVKTWNVCEEDYNENPSTCSCECGNYLASIMDDLVITCHEIITAVTKLNNEEAKPLPKSFREKNIICKIQMPFY